MELAKYTISHKGKIARWDEGLPIGNGWIGNLVFGDDNLVFSLDRAGLWDLTPPPEWEYPEYNYDTMVKLVRSAKAGNEEDWKKFKKIFDGTYGHSTPTKINAGKLVFDFPVDDKTEFYLDIADGLIVVKNEYGTVKTLLSADKKYGIAVFDKKYSFKAEFPEYYFAEETKDNLHGKTTKGLGYAPTKIVEVDGVKCYVHKTGYGQTFGIAVKEIIKGNDKILYYYVFDEKNEELALQNVKEVFAVESDLGTLYKENVKWWDEFWAESKISVPDQMLERLYYLTYYQMRSANVKGGWPTPAQSLWTCCDGNLPPWKGDYHHDLNTQFMYMSYMRANHLDTGYVFIDYLWGLRDYYRQFAREFHGVQGMIVPAVCGLDGKPLGGWAMYSLSPTMSIWLAKSFIDYYDYTADKSFLEEKAYVFTKEVCDAILSMMEERDGKLYLPLSSSPEYNDGEKEAFLEWSNNDIQLVDYGFKEVIRLAKILGKDKEVEKFQIALTKLDEYYVNERLVMCLDNHGQMVEVSHRHHANVMNIYPLKTLRPTTEEKELTIERNLLRLEELGTGQWVGFSYPWFAGLSATKESANRALYHLQMFARCFCQDDNGFHLNGDYKKYGVSLFHYRPFTIEANYCFCDVLQDMLIEDKDGYIKLFPCVPNEWKKESISFDNFLCRGGVFASAKYDGGKVSYFTLTSDKEITIKIRNNFGAETLKFSNGVLVNAKIGEIFELKFNGKVELC